MKLQINKGTKFGKLTYIEDAPKLRLPSGQINRMALCQCECGNVKAIRVAHLVRLRTISALIDFNIQSFIRRVHDCMENGVRISWRKADDKSGVKIFYMSMEDRAYNARFVELKKV